MTAPNQFMLAVLLAAGLTGCAAPGAAPALAAQPACKQVVVTDPSYYRDHFYNPCVIVADHYHDGIAIVHVTEPALHYGDDRRDWHRYQEWKKRHEHHRDDDDRY